MRQRSLFADEYEVRADVLEALAGLEFDRALDLVWRAREREPEDPDLGVLEAATVWLAERWDARRDPTEQAAAAFVDAGHACDRGTLAPSARKRVDEAVAAYAERAARLADPFVDLGRRLPVCALHLVRGVPERAQAVAWDALRADREARADLHGYFGDVHVALGFPSEAAASYGRALALDAQAVDLARCRDERLVALYESLRAHHGPTLARELLLPRAWLERLVEVECDLDRVRHVLERRAALPPAATDVDRARRFAALLYLDRASSAGGWEQEQRVEMAELRPDLFPAVLAEIRRREQLRRPGRALGR
jgi:tetratricopeptide (TPR) repeat protein